MVVYITTACFWDILTEVDPFPKSAHILFSSMPVRNASSHPPVKGLPLIFSSSLKNLSLTLGRSLSMHVSFWRLSVTSANKATRCSESVSPFSKKPQWFYIILLFPIFNNTSLRPTEVIHDKNSRCWVGLRYWICSLVGENSTNSSIFSFQLSQNSRRPSPCWKCTSLCIVVYIQHKHTNLLKCTLLHVP